MSSLTITAADVKPVEVFEQFPAPSGEALTAGQYARINTTTGYIAAGNASSSGEVGAAGGYRGLAMNTVAANETTTIVKRGIVSLGDALSGLNYGDPVYLGDTDNLLQTTAGTVSTVVGYVVAGYAATTPDKLLWVQL